MTEAPERSTLGCAICGNKGDHRLYSARESMYDTGECFSYLECGACGCLQLLDVPANLAHYYPSDYCARGAPRIKSLPAWRRSLKMLWTRAFLGHFGEVPHRLSILHRLPPYGPWMKGLPLELDARILDVGCGNGQLLVRMQKDGFRHLMGIDAFVERDVDYPGGIRIRKQGIEDINGEFDLIMLHHSLEHMPDQWGTLAALRTHLSTQGRMVVRLPLAGSYAWRKYGICWANLDAPRHLFLHTLRSFYIIATKAGLVIERTLFDSHYKQIALSELLSLGYSMREADHLMHRYYTPGEIDAMREAARRLNAKRDGDAAAFILIRSEGGKLQRALNSSKKRTESHDA